MEPLVINDAPYEDFEDDLKTPVAHSSWLDEESPIRRRASSGLGGVKRKR
jgi:hypothetical protein